MLLPYGENCVYYNQIFTVSLKPTVPEYLDHVREQKLNIVGFPSGYIPGNILGGEHASKSPEVDTTLTVTVIIFH